MTYANMEKFSPRTANISQKGYCPAKFTSFLAIQFHSQSLKNRNCPEVYYYLLMFPCRISVRNVQGKHEAVQCGLCNLFRSQISSKINAIWYYTEFQSTFFSFNSLSRNKNYLACCINADNNIMQQKDQSSDKPDPDIDEKHNIKICHSMNLYSYSMQIYNPSIKI